MTENPTEGNCMSGAIREVSHQVLQSCQRREPEAFYPRSDGSHFDRTALDAALDQLRLGGFLEIADWTQDKGQGYRLTDAGREAIGRPSLLSRPAVVHARPQLRVIHPDEHVVRTLLEPEKPIIVPVLLALNILIYIGTVIYNVQLGFPLGSVLGGRMVLPWSLIPARVQLLDEWWRLLTYMFLHGSILHILFNMYALYVLGGILESRWGRWRFLVLYFGSGLIAGLAAILFTTDPLRGTVGASGAIAGMLTSLGVWAWMHRDHLPPQFLEANYRAVGTNLILLVIISLQPNISMSAHAGGAVAGALLSVPLAWMGPSSPTRSRAMGFIALAMITIVCVVAMMIAPPPDLNQLIRN